MYMYEQSQFAPGTDATQILVFVNGTYLWTVTDSAANRPRAGTMALWAAGEKCAVTLG